MLKPEVIELLYCTIQQCHAVTSIDALNHVMTTAVAQLLDNQISAYGVGEISSRKILYRVNLGFPESYLASVIGKDGVLTSPVLYAWQQNAAPQLIELAQLQRGDLPKQYNKMWCKAFADADLRNLLSHGMCDMAGKRASYFCFARIASLDSAKHLQIVETLTPHLHVALTHAIEHDGIQYDSFRLSQRERQILCLMSQSQSNLQIASQLDITESTVKTHVRNVYSKLQVSSRVEATRKAIVEGIC